MVRMISVSKSFSDVTALADVTFEAREGITVIIGPNGAGKTTALKCMSGVLRPDSGRVEVFGRHPEDVKERIAVLTEDRKILRGMTIRDYEEMMPLVYKNWNWRLFRSLMARFSFQRNKSVERMSAGMKTIFLLSLVLSSGADLVLLDEPTQHLDPLKLQDIETMIREMREGGRTVIVASHHLEEVEGFADRFVIISGGRVIYQDEIDAAKEKHRVVPQGQITDSDEVIEAVGTDWLVKTEEDKGRYSALREIVLAYLSREDKRISRMFKE